MSTEDTGALAPADGSYEQLLADLRGIIAGGRGRAAAAVNTEMVATYWQIGERIVREEQGGVTRAAYGTQVLARLGHILAAEFGRGFAEQSLRAMRQFFQAYPNRSTLRSALSWSHYRILMRLPQEQRSFYEQGAITGRWSSRELDRQINSMLAERVVLSRKPEQTLAAAVRTGQEPASVDTVFKNPYILDFLGLQDTHSERDLEAALVRHIEKFLLELGTGFAFMGRQQRLTVDGVDYHVDLVFFHRDLKCQVFVDLKMGKLAPADVAQMKMYVNWARRYDKREWENDPIGLILCGSRSNQVIELLLSDSSDSVDERIKVAQYLLLDTETALRERLAQLSEVWDQHEGHTSGDENS